MSEKSEQVCASLDHGILNVPLAKRGNIDAQIDRYKADQARQERRGRQTRAEKVATDRIEAKALLEAADPAFIADLAAKCGITPAAMRSQLKSDAHWLPRSIIGIFAPRQVSA